MKFIDTHTHIFSEEFNSDRKESIARAKEAGIQCMVMPNIDGSSIASLLAVASEFPGYCFPLMGLHPTSVKENFEKELDIVEKEFSIKKYYGVGEIGIDLYWDKTHVEQQKVAFRHQLRLAKKLQLPVVIHSRNSFDEILEIVDSEIDSSLSGVFHSFTGTLENYEHIVKYNSFMVGIGGVVTYKNGGVDKVLANMDINKIVLETDSPYLSPVPMRGKRNESANIVFIAKKIAEVLNVSVEEVASSTTSNALKLFDLTS